MPTSERTPNSCGCSRYQGIPKFFNPLEYLTNHARLRLRGDWRVGLHELVLELVALSLDKVLSSESENFDWHFERFAESGGGEGGEGGEDGEICVGWLVINFLCLQVEGGHT